MKLPVIVTLTRSVLLVVSGKEDLDLGPNDLHLDDFLLSGKFDLIAYADPELNLEDKKDMFNEELDLGEQVEEKEVGERKDGFSGTRKTDGHSYVGQVKQEVQDVAKTEARDVSSAAQQSASQAGLVTTSRPPRPPGAPATKVGPSLIYYLILTNECRCEPVIDHLIMMSLSLTSVPPSVPAG